MSQPSSKTSFNQSLVFAALVSLFAVVLLGALTKPTSARKTSIAAMPNLQDARAGDWKIAQPPGQSVVAVSPSTYGAIWTPRESNRNWYSVASSADGSKLVAVVKGGRIYTSTDSGVSWTPRDTNRNWHTVTSSADGAKLAAVVNGGQVYTSTDSGVSWTARETDRPWFAIASSADGSKLAATVVGDHILTSINSGLTWVTRDANRNWRTISSSTDGNKLVALDSNNLIYTSTDSGVSWTPRESNRNWYATASSADGSKLVATVGGGQIYTSTDSGVSWTPRESNRIWESVASSADGSKLVAVMIGGQIYTSTDSGVNWTPRETNRNWESVAASADGSKLVAVVNGGQIYTSIANSTPTITALAQARIAGSPAANVQVATANDADETANILQIQISSDGANFSNTATFNGVTITLTDSNAGATGVNPNASGQAFADVVTACGASNASFTLKVTDSLGATGTATLTVAVNTNTPPTLSYNNPAAIVAGFRTTVNPVTGPSDNGTISSIIVQSSRTFTGTIDVNTAGLVSVANAAPVGTHSITIRATDNCGATTDATFMLTITCISSLTVNNSGDDLDALPGDGVCETVTGNGICTLRAAIQEFNGILCAPLTINFNIPGVGPHTITPATIFPQIHKPVVIDGTTQPGASCTAAGGLKIELNGINTQGHSSNSGLELLPEATGSLIKGLVINRFGSYGIVLSGQFGNSQTVQCNYIGTDVTGTVELGNKNGGIQVNGNNHLIGGITTGTGNLISGNVGSGIKINGTGIQVKGNYIGVNASGTGAITNIGAGVEIQQLSSNIVIGGQVLAARNIISGNVLGIIAVAATNVVIKGNYIGTDVSGTQAIGNHSGITLASGPISTSNCIIGGIGVGEANIIAFNTHHLGSNNYGITVDGINNIVRGNSIFSNAGLGIDLAPLGVLTDNDWRELNGLQNFPIITNADAGATIVSGTLNSGPNMAFIIDVYSNTACDPSGYGEGKTYLGSTTTALTDDNGDVSFNVTVPPLQAGQFITATATATDGRFNTSEFSRCKAISSPPTISPSGSLARQQGSAASNSQIATVSDTSAGTLAVVATTVPTGLVVTNIVNNGGTITADVAALCNATVGANTVALTVTNGTTSLTNTASLTVNVTVNTAPALGAYPNTNVIAGGSTTVTPNSAPNDNGLVTSITAVAAGALQSPFSAIFAVNSTTGVITITDAKPAGTYTVTVTAMDNCELSSTSSFTLTVNNPATCSPVCFGFTQPIGSPFGAGSEPNSVAVGDFNGDGRQDLAVANDISNDVTILLGNGSGGFTQSSGSPVGVGNHPESAAVGDFNGDGKHDLAVVNYGSGNVTILLGNGSGGFIQPSGSPISVGTNPEFVVVGDFNSDGKLDLAVANLNSNNVTILLGNGNGSFSPATGSPFGVGINPFSVVVGDFDGNGIQDLAVANINSNNVTIMLGNGSGGFSLATSSPVDVGTTPVSVVAGDFNGDGKQDIATANINSNNVTILLSNGSGGFTQPAVSPISVVLNPKSLAVGDFNGDSKQDLAVAISGSDNVTILLGNGSGGFTQAPGLPIGAETRPYSLTVGDFNGDGKQDLVTANRFSDNVTILLNNCAPTITAGTITRQQGSPSGPAVPIATVSDAESGAGSLTVAIIAGGTATGITLGPLTNNSGTISAKVAASCSATSGTVRLEVTDGAGLTANGDLQITVDPNLPPTLVYASPQAVANNGSLNVSPMTATDNGSITDYQIVSVVPPLSTAPTIDSSGVVMITNANPPGGRVFTISATDNCLATTNAMLTLNVACPTIILPPPMLPGGTVGAGYSQSVSASPSGTYSYGVTSGALPTGLTLNLSDGTVSGTPTAAGTFNFRITADLTGTGCSNFRDYSVVIACPTVTLNPTTLPGGSLGVGYNQSVTASPAGIYTYGVTSGALPNGLMLNTSNGTISGAPTVAGVFNFRITATMNGCIGFRNYTIAICPIINACPTNITTNAANGQCWAVVNYTPPTTNAGCAGTTVACVPGSGSSFAVGTTTVTCTETDAFNNMASCSFTVTVNDTQAPTVNCPANISANTAAGTCAATLTYTTPTAADNCSNPTVTCSPASGSSFALGTTTVTCTPRDAANNIGMACTFAVTVSDNVAPTIGACPSNISANTAAGTCAATVSFIAPTALDNCTLNPTVTCTPASSSSFALGTTTVTCSAKDAANNTSASCAFTVTVFDNQNPSIGACPTNISLPAANGSCSAVATFATPTATDNCGAATVTCVPASGMAFTVGVTTVTCTAKDAANNLAMCAFTVRIIDTQLPVLGACPANVSVNTSAVGCFANVNYTAPIASDNCTASPTVTCTPAPGSSFSLGVTTVTCTVTDEANNQSPPCSFTVTVRDSIAPIFGACPKNIYADTSAGACTATATYTAPTATDNCTTNPTVTCTPASGSSFALGVTTVTCSAKDAANNTSNACSFTVIVSDNVAPTLGACPANISANSTAGMCTSVVNYPLPTAMDNCTANPTVTCNPVPGATFIIGVTTVTCRATDSANNPSSSCSFTVTVKDTQPPVLACPANISVTATGGAGSAVVTYSTPIPTDNCMISEPFCVLTPTAIPPLVCSDTSGKGVTASCTPPSGANFPLGVTTVTCTASDSATPPNTATCNFTVTVTSCTSIVCPADIFTATATTTRVVNYLLPTANGSCGTITCTPAPGSTFNLGTTTVSCSNSVGNQTCAFRVTVNRIAASANDPLVCTGPGNTVQATLVISNNGTVNQTVSDTTTFTNLVGVPGSCTASPNVGACSVTNAGLTYNATLTPGQTVTLTYLTQVGNLAQSGAQVCTNNAVTFSGGPAFEFSVCDMIDCPAVGPGNPTTAGSALIYNVYTSSTDPAKQNTRINVTNSHPRLPAFVHLFFVAEGCSVADSYVCLTANQTTSFLASDLDPGTTGYLVAVAVDARGCPTDFNYLLGDEYVKFASGHAANLTAEAFAALAGGLPACDGNSVTAQLDFDGTSYSRLPAVLAASNVGSRADGNDTLLIVNRIGGNLGIGASTLGTLFGVFYDDAENALSFSVSGNCQLRNSISNNFPRTTPRFESFIPAGRTGWLKLSNQAGTVGITGATINFNANATAAAGAFNQGHNLHALTLNTTNSFVIPVFPPSC